MGAGAGRSGMAAGVQDEDEQVDVRLQVATRGGRRARVGDGEPVAVEGGGDGDDVLQVAQSAAVRGGKQFGGLGELGRAAGRSCASGSKPTTTSPGRV